ncbi:MAG: hypothetical protein BGO78_10080 [Chloroflexi bacterium 44-23]|nr:MAG: hypothetical protein BGO78_10080 [Chloroflexi bacterium 44-23]
MRIPKSKFSVTKGILLVFVLLSISFLVNLKENLNINLYSVYLAKQIYLTKPPRTSLNPIEGNFTGKNSCHIQWLNAISTFYKNEPDRDLFYKTFTCMKESVDMTYFLLPKDVFLAKVAINLYPEDVNNYYWLLASLEESDVNLAAKLSKEFVVLFPTDALLWGMSGRLLWLNAQYEDALQAYINACKINDRVSNGCYYVGISYRSLGDLVEAIKYFRLSIFPSSQLEADNLEAQLPSGEIVP